MSDLWERVKRTAGEIYLTATEKTVEGVNLGVRHLDVASIRRDLSREFAGLGGRVYQLLKREEPDAIPSDPTVLHHMNRLRELEERLEEREAEIRRLRESGVRADRRGGPVPGEPGEGGAVHSETEPGTAGSGQGPAEPPRS